MGLLDQLGLVDLQSHQIYIPTRNPINHSASKTSSELGSGSFKLAEHIKLQFTTICLVILTYIVCMLTTIQLLINYLKSVVYLLSVKTHLKQ
jgi:uncharacterized membrane protein